MTFFCHQRSIVRSRNLSPDLNGKFPATIAQNVTTVVAVIKSRMNFQGAPIIEPPYGKLPYCWGSLESPLIKPQLFFKTPKRKNEKRSAFDGAVGVVGFTCSMGLLVTTRIYYMFCSGGSL